MAAALWRLTALIRLCRQWPHRSRLILACYEDYERKVNTRIPGVDRRTGLEQEGRGLTALRGKWRATMRHWGSPKMQREAAKPPPKEPEPDPSADFKKAEEKAKATGDTFEYLNIEQILALGRPQVAHRQAGHRAVAWLHLWPARLAQDIHWAGHRVVARHQAVKLVGLPGAARRHRGLHLKRGSRQPEVPHQVLGAAPQGAHS